MDWRAVGHRRRAGRLSQVVVRRDWVQCLPGNLGRVARRRQETQGQGPPHRPNRRTHVRRCAGLVVPVFVVLGREGGRGRRQDGGLEQPGNHRIGQVRGWFLERHLRRGWARLGRHNNNRAFLSGTISATNNGASIYIEAKRKPEVYLTEKGSPMWKDILHARIPKGPGGQFNLPGPFTDILMGYSKNQKAAKDFLRWIHSKPVFAEWFTSQQGYTTGATSEWEKNKVWEVDPVLLPFRDIPPFGRLPGYAGPPNRKAAEVVTKYIITDMY